MPASRHLPPEHRAVAIGLALVVLGVAGFVGVLDAVREADDLAVLDEPVLTWLVGLRSPGMTAFLTAVTTASGPAVLPDSWMKRLAFFIWPPGSSRNA